MSGPGLRALHVCHEGLEGIVGKQDSAAVAQHDAQIIRRRQGVWRASCNFVLGNGRAA